MDIWRTSSRRTTAFGEQRVMNHFLLLPMYPRTKIPMYCTVLRTLGGLFLHFCTFADPASSELRSGAGGAASMPSLILADRKFEVRPDP